MDREPGKSLSRQLAALTVRLSKAPAVPETADMVARYTLQGVGCSHAGVALTMAGRLCTAAATDPVVLSLDEVQLRHGDGPLISAVESGKRVWIRDVRDEHRWPAWRASTDAYQLRTVLLLPLTRGALTLFGSLPDAFDSEDVAIAELIAHHADLAITRTEQEARLEDAVQGRRVIGRAIGIMMARHRLDSAEAFAVLKRFSQDTNTRLRDVAERLVTD